MSIPVLAMGVVGLLLAGAGLGEGWVPVRSDADRFAVALPGRVYEAADTHWTLAGPVRSRTWATRGADDCWVSVHRMPVLARSFTSEAGLLARAGRGLVEDDGGEELGVAPALLAGRPARAVAWRSRDGRTGNARLVLVEDRLFVLATLRSGDGFDLERFFGSFEVW